VTSDGIGGQPERSLVVWCPDWPVQAAAAEAGLPLETPIALLDKGLVHACSAAARAEGVRRGLKVREAQSRCASLAVLLYNPALDARSFEPVLEALEAGIPTLQVVRPGVVVIRAQGPARYYGGEREAALAVLGLLDAAGVREGRVGIADGPFAAEQAARRASGAGGPGGDRIGIIPPGGSAAFLAPLPVALLGLPPLVALLGKLGVRSLGAFAALDVEQVRDRFGPEGEAAHRVAAGLDPRRVVARVKPADRTRRIDFEPPLDRIDQIAFALRQTAEGFLDALAEERLVCTALTVAVTSERGERRTRTWLHPRVFTPLDVIDRVRWQLQGSAGSGDSSAELSAGIVSVLLEPASLDEAANHEQGLWGGGPDERIHHALSRVQSMLGHDAVLSPAVGGGRLVADRRVLVPWGERPLLERPADRPWPGRLPGFSPSTVLGPEVLVRVLDPAGEPVRVDERGLPSGPPATFTAPLADPVLVQAWGGPWPLEERWWDGAATRRLHRLQLVTAEGTAWLLCFEDGGWWAEARYD
jgi:protein ImuB